MAPRWPSRPPACTDRAALGRRRPPRASRPRRCASGPTPILGSIRDRRAREWDAGGLTEVDETHAKGEQKHEELDSTRLHCRAEYAPCRLECPACPRRLSISTSASASIRMEGGAAGSVDRSRARITPTIAASPTAASCRRFSTAAMGAAVISAIPKEWWCATTGLSIQFVAGAREGTLTATGRVVRRGRSIAFVQGEAHDAKGALVATAQGTWHLWPHKPEMDSRASAASRRRRRARASGSGVGKILAVGRNYADHNVEMGNARPVAAGPVPEAPVGPRARRRRRDASHRARARSTTRSSSSSSSGAPAGRSAKASARSRPRLRRRPRPHAARSPERSQEEGRALGSLARGSTARRPCLARRSRSERRRATSRRSTLTLDVNGVRQQAGSTAQMLHGVAALCRPTRRAGSPWSAATCSSPERPSGVGPLVAGDRRRRAALRPGHAARDDRVTHADVAPAGRRVLITGASAGIGRAATKAFVERGRRRASRWRGRKTGSTRSRPSSGGRERVATYVADVADGPAMEALASAILAERRASPT